MLDELCGSAPEWCIVVHTLPAWRAAAEKEKEEKDKEKKEKEKQKTKELRDGRKDNSPVRMSTQEPSTLNGQYSSYKTVPPPMTHMARLHLGRCGSSDAVVGC